MPPSNGKYYCPECGWAAKSACPVHPGRSIAMGKAWRPGKKGRKTRLWDNRVKGSPTGRLHVAAAPEPWLIRLGARDYARGSGRFDFEDPVAQAIYARAHKERPWWWKRSTRQVHPLTLRSATPLGHLALQVHDRSIHAVDRQDLGARRRVQAKQLVPLLLDLKDAVDGFECEPVILEGDVEVITDHTPVRDEDVPRTKLGPAGALELIQGLELEQSLLITGDACGIRQATADGRSRTVSPVPVPSQAEVIGDLIQRPAQGLQAHGLGVTLGPALVRPAGWEREQDLF